MPRYNDEAARFVLDFIGCLVHAKNEWAGAPFALLDWQIGPLRQFYGTMIEDEDGREVRQYQYFYEEIPK